jgi:hypothetical protein
MQRDDSVNELDRLAPIHCRHTEAGLTADTLGLGGPARRASKTERLAVSFTRSWKKAGGRGRLTLGTKPDTQTPNPKCSDPDPKYPNLHYLISGSDNESYYPNLYRVITPGTRKTRIGIRIRLPAIKCSSKLVKALLPN